MSTTKEIIDQHTNLITNSINGLKTKYCSNKKINNTAMNKELDDIDFKYDKLKSNLKAKYQPQIDIEKTKCHEICNSEKKDLPFFPNKTKCKTKCDDESVLSFFTL